MRLNRFNFLAVLIESVIDFMIYACPVGLVVIGYYVGARLLLESLSFAHEMSEMSESEWHYRIAGSGMTVGLAYYLITAFVVWKCLPLPVRAARLLFNCLRDDRAALHAGGRMIADELTDLLLDCNDAPRVFIGGNESEYVTARQASPPAAHSCRFVPDEYDDGYSRVARIIEDQDEERLLPVERVFDD